MQFVEVLFCLEFSCVEFSLKFFGTAKQDCLKRAREIFNFPSLINNSVTIGLSFFYYKAYQQSYHQIQLIFFVFYLDCILQYFYKYYHCYLNIQ